MASSTLPRARDQAERRRPSYQIAVVGLLSLNFGIVCFDRNALNYLMPFVKPELGLTNLEVGLLASSLSLTWSFAAFGMGWLSDFLRRRKVLLIGCTVVFSLCSFLSGLAGTFAMLLLARLLMGLAEGGVLPLSHAIVATEVAPERRGLAQAIAQNVGSNLFGSVVAPLLLVAFAAAYGWRSTFFLAGAPGLVSALLIWLVIKERNPRPSEGEARQIAERGSAGLFTPLRDRNVAICVALGILLVAYLVVFWAFMPLYLAEARGLSKVETGSMLSILGLSAALGSFVAAGLSDWLGRRPIIVLVGFLSIVLPLTALWFDGPIWLMGAIFFVFGWGVNGLLPLVAATVPSESVSTSLAATALGLCMGSGELIGGVLGPIFAGLAADTFGAAAPLWIMVGLALISGFIALGLRETAPSRRMIGKPLEAAA